MFAMAMQVRRACWKYPENVVSNAVRYHLSSSPIILYFSIIGIFNFKEIFALNAFEIVMLLSCLLSYNFKLKVRKHILLTGSNLTTFSHCLEMTKQCPSQYFIVRFTINF